MLDHQSAVLNRTDRKVIHSTAITWTLEHGIPGKITRIDPMGWAESIPDDLFEAAIFYVDLNSAAFAHRYAHTAAKEVIEPTWHGMDLPLNPEESGGNHRVKMQVTVALPAGHPDEGKILARSNEILVIAGPEGEGESEEGESGSILPVSPDSDMENICRLEFGPDGPRLKVTNRIDSLNWKDIASSPTLKYGAVTTWIEAVLIHIALHAEDAPGWAEDWLRLPGIDGTDHEIQSDDDRFAAYQKAAEWARNCAESVAMCRSVIQLLQDAIANG